MGPISPLTSRRRRAALIVVLALALGGCTIDDPQVNDVGAANLLLVNPLVQPQVVGIGDPGSIDANQIQSMFWDVTRADLTLGTGDVVDLLGAGGVCQFVDNSLNVSANFGQCIDAIALQATDEAMPPDATLTLDFSLTVKRIIPIILPPLGDRDGDGVLNGADNCPTIANPGQEDLGGVGIGDACRRRDAFGSIQLDSDADGVVDGADNCVDIANPFQINTPGTALEALATDGIGDACRDFEQAKTITGQTATITFPFTMPDQAALIVVDFNDELVLPADCFPPDMDTCNDVQTTAIRACITTSLFEASLGCPDE